MDLFDIAVASKLAGGGGGGGNPNTTETVTGTIASMFGDVNFSELMNALASNNASAYVEADASALSAGTIDMILYSDGDTIAADGGGVSGTHTSGYIVDWVSGSLSTFKVYNDTTITDMSAYASMIPTTLTIVWHPLT